MSLLTIVQQAALKCLGTLPSQITSAVNSGDQNIQTLIGVVNEEGQETSSAHSWQGLRNEASFGTVGAVGGILKLSGLVGGAGYASGFSTTYGFVWLTGGHGTGAVATIAIVNGAVTSVTINVSSQGSGYQVGDVLSATQASLGGTGGGFSITVATVGIVGQQAQGLILTLAGADFNFIVNETFWDRTTRRPVFGPKSPAEWQQLQAQLMQGPWYQYTIRGNQLLMLPAPAPGDQIFFEWCSKNWCTSLGGAGQAAMVADTDVSKIDETLITLGAIWRFKQDRRIAYQADFDKWQGKFDDLTSRDGAKARLNLAGVQNDIYPGIIVPSGNWPISGEPSQ